MAALKAPAMPAGLTLAWSHSKSLTQADPGQFDLLMAFLVCSTNPSALMSANNSGMGPQTKVFGNEKVLPACLARLPECLRFSSAL
jgi:hypothetical protein